jgi:hypothetical protein
VRSEDLIVGGAEELERVSRVLEAERSRRLVDVERRGAWAVDGHLSVVSWLAARLPLGYSRASQQVKLARALRAMPVTAEASGSGELSCEAVRLLVGAREAAPEAFDNAEAMLVEAAMSLPTRDLRTAIAYWRQAAGAEEPARHVYEGRHLHVSPVLDGCVRIDGDLDPESGQTLITALRSVEDAWSRDGLADPRSAPQRRADALTELCRAWLDRSDRPQVAGERPHVVVTVDLQTLERRAGERSELTDTGPITPEAARRLACDAGVSRVITVGTHGRGTQDRGRACRDATGTGAARRRVPLPRLRLTPGVVRRPPRTALGRRP